jgi:hypothetical protein
MGKRVDALTVGEVGQMPAQLKQFIQKGAQDDPDQIFMKLGYMAHAYGSAFTQLAESALEDWPKKNYIVQPMVYLARHSMELYLKWAIREYQEFLGDYSEKSDHHNLMKLWNSLTKLLTAAGAPTDTEYSKHCLKLLNHINQIDPDGEQFRYPHKKDGEAFELAKVNLEELVKAHWHVSGSAEAYVEMIPDLAEEVTEEED